tara:strand:- start:137 stop:490 length:354 start_codon:yes stop_codon:yes gene_type:complete
MNTVEKITQEQIKSEIPEFNVGDVIRIHVRIVEGDKERIQAFSGTVIGRKGTGINETFTVRRVHFGEGVERIFPLNSPKIAKIEVETRGDVRRSKLYYLRDRVGKAARVKEKMRGAK